MQPVKPFSELLVRLWRCISNRRQKQFGLLLILMVLTSFAEILSIGAVLPFLGMLTSPGLVFEHPAIQPFVSALGLTSHEQLSLPLTVLFSVAAVTAGVMRLLLLWSSGRLSFASGAELSLSLYRRTLYQPYAIHITRNSSEVIDGILTKVWGLIYGVILPILSLVSAGIMLIAILIALLYVSPLVALAAFGGFGLIYASVIKLTRNRLMVNSQVISIASPQLVKSLQEGLGGIRDVLIDGSQATYCEIYQSADRPLRQAQANNYFISGSPRFATEALGTLFIAGLAYAVSQQPDGITKAIPVLGALALGAQRLLPVLQQAYGAWASIRGGGASLQATLDLLEQPLPIHAGQTRHNQLPFRKQLKLNNLSFRYNSHTPWVFRNLGLTIEKGSCVGFIGKTGSGKSTLLDIVMGLLQPTEGALEVDNEKITIHNLRDWQSHIAHVPQSVFLADSSIEENIAFGELSDKIDHVRVRQAADQAQIADIIETWPQKYKTNVGERGIQLSGGQRQRIGIARALYKQADVIIFDEATSALDNETEFAVMQSIARIGNSPTILIIAHRLSTLTNCTKIVEVGNSGILQMGTYEEIVAPTD